MFYGKEYLIVKTITANDTIDGNHDVIECNNSSDITVSLPAVAGYTGRIFTVRKVGNNSNTVVIDPNGSETIERLTTITLYVRDDSITFYSNGTEWLLVSDGRFKHSCKIYRSASQTGVLNATVTPILFDTVLFDTGGISDIANNRIVFKRSGTYLIQASIRFQGIGDTKQVQSRMNKNGSIFDLKIFYSPVAAAIVYAFGVTTLSVTAGDTLTFSTYQDSGGTLSTDSEASHGFDATPQILATEL